MTLQGRGSIDNVSWMMTLQGLRPWDQKQETRGGRRFRSLNRAAHVGSSRKNLNIRYVPLAIYFVFSLIHERDFNYI